ncbi:signal peptidase I [Arthrobacter sp. Sa2CUA1]|uniref:Signal peptidase I n=1 Tax=Arthrobacter gallicola TaxID=2762225 RepID=A0ABR8UU06_9MICC|nr:signal peptidase I [Arthrobacter gallicola]MBD7996056.1 signal peptidase I [Arthrobacter gallicola]
MSTGHSTASPAVRALKLAGTAVSLVAMCVASLAALVLIIAPLVTGSQTYTVLTSSMAPKYAPGTFLVVQPTPADALRTGDIITFQIESGKPAVITHRITGISTGQNGERTFTTKGDNNSLADAAPVQEAQIRGKLLYAVPYVGFVANSLGNSERGEIGQWAAVGLLGYGVVLLVRGALQNKRRRNEPAVLESPESPEPFEPASESDPLPVPHSPRHRFGAADDQIDAHDIVLFDCDDCEHGDYHRNHGDYYASAEMGRRSVRV